MARRQRTLPTQDRARAMRRSLLDATVRLLERDGAARLSTTAIVREAHVSSGTFYRYFNDRAEIVGVLRDEAVTAIEGDLMASVVRALDADLAPALRDVVTTLVAGFEQHRAVMLALVDQVPAGTNANVLPEIEADLRQLAGLLPRRHRPDLDPARAEAVVFMLMGVLVSTCLRIALTPPPDVDRDLLVELAVSMVVAGMLAIPGGSGPTPAEVLG